MWRHGINTTDRSKSKQTMQRIRSSEAISEALMLRAADEEAVNAPVDADADGVCGAEPVGCGLFHLSSI